ncbi:class I SAM-dependent methyltransferase [Pimelobacter simplex]|nr:class I SAM-dependent methyltransferase [Pimelobacter simplex]
MIIRATATIHRMQDTTEADYTARLRAKQDVWWKRALHVQAPYQWNIRRQGLGRTLEIGCGIGRNLATLAAGSVGVDHNVESIEEARSRGYAALTVAEWEASDLRVPDAFDGFLVAHVIEHMDASQARAMMNDYLPYLRPGGRVLFVCPQERGYDSDPTHVEFVDGEALCSLAADVGLVPQRSYSFPFPRFTGKAFIYNEFCVVATKPLKVP